MFAQAADSHTQIIGDAMGAFAWVLIIGWLLLGFVVPLLVLFCALYAGRAQYYARLCVERLKKQEKLLSSILAELPDSEERR